MSRFELASRARPLQHAMAGKRASSSPSESLVSAHSPLDLKIQKKPAGRSPKGLASKLMFLAVCAVPFQQALTIPVGFPLKISEVAGLLAVVLYLVEGRKSSSSYSGSFLQWGLLALVTISSLSWLVKGPPLSTAVGYERGMDFDMLLYLGYAIIVIFVSWFAGTRLGPKWISRGTGVAIVAAAFYCLLQGALSVVGLEDTLETLGGATQVGTAYGFGFTRNGPFLEGNYLGFFAGVALFLALRSRSRAAIASAAFCLIYSQSTVALVGVVIGILVVALLRPSGRLAGAFAGVVLAALIVLSVVDSAAIYLTRQLAKLGLIEGDAFGASIEYSLRNRTATIQRGLDMSSDFLLFGVGPGRYGYWDDFYSLSGISGGRGIANNAYVQVLAEVGIVAALCFAGLLVILIVRSVRGRRSTLALAVFLVVGLNASPSWTVLPVWFAIAFLATCEREMSASVRTLGERSWPTQGRAI